MAPETVLSDSSDFKVDVWGLGTLLYALICARMPFNGKDKDDITASIVLQELKFKASVWATVSEECKDPLVAMLQKDSYLRPTINQVLDHPWFAKHVFL